MNNSKKRAPLLLGMLALGPFLTGCASQHALRLAINEREDEIRDLREERVNLKMQIQDISSARDQLEVSLSEASMRLRTQPAKMELPRETAAPAFPELDDVGVSYGMRDGNVVLTLPSAISFASGKAELTESGQTALRAVAKRLTGEYRTEIYSIEGHTDSDPIRRSGFSSNRDLSLERAMAVLTFLVESCEMADERFLVVGHGQYRPVASNDSDAGKAENRRVEIVVLKAE